MTSDPSSGTPRDSSADAPGSVPPPPSFPEPAAYSPPDPTPPTQEYPPAAPGYPPAAPYPGETPVASYPGELPPGLPPVGAPAKSGTARKIIIIVIVATVLLALCCVGGAIAIIAASDSDKSASPTTTHPSGVFATSTATAEASGPFGDSPAANYPKGADGITMPEAKAVTGFTKAEVTAALAKVRDAMIAARLDTRMVVDHDNSKLLGMLAKDSRADIENDFAKQGFFSYASQIAPGFTLDTSETPRVKGRITYRATTESDIRFLEVITNFVWVYPFAGITETDPLVVVHDEVHWYIPVNEDVEKTTQGLWINEATGYASNIDCDLLDKSLLAPDTSPSVVTGSTEDPDAMFDPDHNLEIEDSC